MHFLSTSESKEWRQLGDTILNSGGNATDYQNSVRTNLFSAFCFYIGVRYCVEANDIPAGKEWFKEGALSEADGLFSNAFMMAFLTRQDDQLIMPAVCFEDPQPYVHFTTTPIMKSSRHNFINYFSHTLPAYDQPIKIMDIGTGNGTLCLDILQHLLKTGKVKDFAEVLLIDSSTAMLELAEKTIRAELPDLNINTINCKIQEVSDKIDGHYQVAYSSLAYHHMPFVDKLFHLKNLKHNLDNFILFELDANNDTPDQNSPELVLSVYQSYGRIIDFIFSHDAPVKVAEQSVDNFLMVEEVSFLTHPRGVRTDYHMLRTQWHSLFKEGLGNDFECRSDMTCYADEYLELFALHYGKK